MNQFVDSPLGRNLLADKPWPRIAALTLALAALYGTLQLVLPTGVRNVWIIGLCFPAILIFAPLITLSPAGWATKIQGLAFITIAILVSSLRYREFINREMIQFFSLLVILAVLTVRLPFEKVHVRRIAIAVGIIAFIALITLNRRIPYYTRYVVLAWVWYVACINEDGSLLQGGPRRSFGQFVRIITGMCTIWPFGALAPPRCFVAIERSPATILRGGLWVCVGILMHGGLRELGSIDWLDVPLEGQLEKDGFPVYWGTSLGFWVMTFGQLFSRYIMIFGTLGLLGVRATFPIGRIWEMTDFLRYWRKANVWYYTFCIEVFVRYFIPQRGPGLYLGILAIFSVYSSLRHGGQYTIYTYIQGQEIRGDIQWFRWTLEGILAASTMWWIQHTARVRMARYVTEGKRPKKPSRLQTMTKTVLLLVIVLGLHGVFMRMTNQNYVPGIWRNTPQSPELFFAKKIKQSIPIFKTEDEENDWPNNRRRRRNADTEERQN